MLDVNQIMRILPHRYPFLLVDRIVEFDLEKKTILGLKNVTMNELFFQGHFPGEPVMPGVLVLEAMGQVGALLVGLLGGMGGCQEGDSPGARGPIVYLTTIEQAKFRRPVRPGDQLLTEVELLRIRRKMGKVRVWGRVGEEIAAEAVMGYVLDTGLTIQESQESEEA